MKRNVQKAKRLLDALATLSIDSDKIIQTLGEVRSALEDMEGEGAKIDIDECVRRVKEEVNVLEKERANIDAIRSKGETIIWKGQAVSPYLKHSVEDVEFSEGAMKCIPIGVETIGELVQYTFSELKSSSPHYKNEIRDTLRISFVLVLKPRGK